MVVLGRLKALEMLVEIVVGTMVGLATLGAMTGETISTARCSPPASGKSQSLYNYNKDAARGPSKHCFPQ